MNLAKLAAVVIPALSSCVPVQYDAINWNRVGRTEQMRDVSLSVVLKDQEGNAFNSNSRGPWKIMVCASSKRKHEIVVKSLTILDPSGVSRRFETDLPIPQEFHDGKKEWQGYHIFKEGVLAKNSEGRITLRINVRIDNLPSQTSTFVLTSERLQGKEMVNLLTM